MLNRAYSRLDIKSVDEDARVITGIATTPQPDRMGDIVEPMGAEFTLPLPFLWQHDAKSPIGEVFQARATPAGIEVQIRVAKIADPGLLKDRIDEAWQSIKAKLVRGLSIGFKGIEEARISDTFSYRYIKWAWLELSAVTIPANAEATIQTIKSLDVHASPATGERPLVSSIARATASSTIPRGSMKTISENIADFEKSRTPKSLRMQEIMQKASDEGRTLDEKEATEYDGLQAEVKDFTTHIDRLKALEESQRESAAPVQRATGETTRASSRVVEVKSTLPPGMEFARYVIAMAVGRGNPASALEVAKARYPDQPRIHTLLKAAVAGGTTQDATWAAPLVYAQNLVTEFIDFLRPLTILGKFGGGNVPSLRRVPFNVRITGQTSGGSGYWVGQGKAKPLTKFDFNAVTLPWAKVAAISVISDDLIRFSSPSAEQLVRDGLAAANMERLDVDFIDPAKSIETGVSPGSILNGVAPLTPTGTDIASVYADVKQLFQAFIDANLSPTTGVFIMPQTVALALSMMRNPLGQREFPEISMTGGTFFGLPVITSQYATFGSPYSNIVALVNASDIFLSDDGGFSVDASREASLEMESAPISNIGGDHAGGSPSDPVSAEMVSMFQTNSVAIRSERFINWQRRRDTAVAWLENVLWGTGSPV